MRTPRLSVLIPNYNHAEFLCSALDSILELQNEIFEIIISDDASTDNSWEILQEYANKNPLIRLMRNEKNQGAIRNFQLLLKEAKGEFVMIQAADDYWIPGTMAKLLSLLNEQRYPEVAFYCGRNIYRIEKDKYSYEIPSKISGGLLLPGCVADFQRRVPWGAAGMIARTEMYRNYYELLISSGCYYDRFMQLILAQRYYSYFLDDTIACTRVMDHNFSKSVSREKRDAAFLLLFQLLKTEYRDLYHSMLKSNHYADYEGMFSFLLRTPRIWDVYTLPILLKMIPSVIYRNLRYQYLPKLLPTSLKEWYRAKRKKSK